MIYVQNTQPVYFYISWISLPLPIICIKDIATLPPILNTLSIFPFTLGQISLLSHNLSIIIKGNTLLQYSVVFYSQ